MTDRALKAEYRRLNRRWFGGKLPDIPVRFAKLKGTKTGRTVLHPTEDRAVRILISRRLAPAWAEKLCGLVLLHEMVHVARPELGDGRLEISGVAMFHGEDVTQKTVLRILGHEVLKSFQPVRRHGCTIPRVPALVIG